MMSPAFVVWCLLELQGFSVCDLIFIYLLINFYLINYLIYILALLLLFLEASFLSIPLLLIVFWCKVV